MIEKCHSQLSVRKQCKLLDVNRNRLSPRKPKQVAGDEAVMKEIDRIYTEFPFYGELHISLESGFAPRGLRHAVSNEHSHPH